MGERTSMPIDNFCKLMEEYVLERIAENNNKRQEKCSEGTQ